MIILTYMRSLRLLSIILFIIICGPLLLVCYFKNRPRPTENPEDLVKNFTRVTAEELKQMRSMNYRHKSLVKSSDKKTEPDTPRESSVSASADESLLDASVSTSVLEGQWQTDNPYVLEACCICLDEFETHGHDSGESEQNMIVILPCKAHFFHEHCI